MPDDEKAVLDQLLLVLKEKLDVEYNSIKNFQQQIQVTIGLLGYLKDAAVVRMSLMPLGGSVKDVLVAFVKRFQDISKIENTMREIFRETRITYKQFQENSAKHSEKCEIMKDMFELKINMETIEELSVEVNDILNVVDKPSSLLELCLEKLQDLCHDKLGVSGAIPVTLRTQVSKYLLVK